MCKRLSQAQKSRSEERLFQSARTDYFEAAASTAAEAASTTAEAASEAEAATEAAASEATSATAEAAEAASEAAEAASATAVSSAFLPQAARAMAAINEASRSDFFMLVSSKGIVKKRGSMELCAKLTAPKKCETVTLDVQQSLNCHSFRLQLYDASGNSL